MKFLLFASPFIFAPLLASAVTLNVANQTFTTIATGNNPASWTTVETAGDGVYAQAAVAPIASQGNVLHFKDGDGSATSQYIQQDITANNAGVFANTYSSYTLTMDLGWRNDLSDRGDAQYRISLVDVTDGVELTFFAYTFPVRATGLFDSYSLVQAAAPFTLTYNNTLAAYVGDTIALRIARSDATTSGNFQSTSWIDNVTLSAVPEPSAVIFGLMGLLAMQLRKKR